jgi:hypothetical protein
LFSKRIPHPNSIVKGKRCQSSGGSHVSSPGSSYRHASAWFPPTAQARASLSPLFLPPTAVARLDPVSILLPPVNSPCCCSLVALPRRRNPGPTPSTAPTSSLPELATQGAPASSLGALRLGPWAPQDAVAAGDQRRGPGHRCPSTSASASSISGLAIIGAQPRYMGQRMLLQSAAGVATSS